MYTRRDLHFAVLEQRAILAELFERVAGQIGAPKQGKRETAVSAVVCGNF